MEMETPVGLTPSPPAAGAPKKLFNRYEFQQRLNALRAEVRAADDEYYGAQAVERQLYSTDEVSATPALRWLDINARMQYLKGRERLPPLPATPQRPPMPQRQAAQPQSRTLEPLVDDDGAAVQCPICLRELCDHAPLHPTSAAVRWTDCCGRAFHGHCFEKLSRCPMCRTWPLREAPRSQADCAVLNTVGTATHLSANTALCEREIVLPERVDGVRIGWKRIHKV